MKNILLTREEESNERLSLELEKLKLKVFKLPLIKRNLNYSKASFENFITNLSSIDFLITSNFSLSFFLDCEIKSLLEEIDLSFYVLSDNIKEDLEKVYPKAKFFIAKAKNGTSVANLYLKEKSKRQKLIYISARETIGSVEEVLNNENFSFSKFSVYETNSIKYLDSYLKDFFKDINSINLVFFSQSAVNSFLDIRDIIEDIIRIDNIFVLGEKSAKNLENNYKNQLKIPNSSDIDSLIELIKSTLR